MNLFITGTDTGVGKTFICSQLAKTWVGLGKLVYYYKLIETGVEQKPIDEGEVKQIVNSAKLVTQTLLTFNKAASPHFAAQLEQRSINFEAILQRAKNLPLGDFSLWEGAGGALVPVSANRFIIDFAKEMDLKVVIVARGGLGTINHTLLTVECLLNRGLEVHKVIINPGMDKELDLNIFESNTETIKKRIHPIPTIVYSNNQDLVFD